MKNQSKIRSRNDIDGSSSEGQRKRKHILYAVKKGKLSKPFYEWSEVDFNGTKVNKTLMRQTVIKLKNSELVCTCESTAVKRSNLGKKVQITVIAKRWNLSQKFNFGFFIVIVSTEQCLDFLFAVVKFILLTSVSVIK
uniref:Uncharacterized protein n=1 Tax=Glossina brevipalpis TaxID=37001 RepID=A0A1A9W0B8_9MUSC